MSLENQTWWRWWRPSVCRGYRESERESDFSCGNAAVSLRRVTFRWYTEHVIVVRARLRAVTCSRSLSSPMTAAVFQSMISEKGSSQPLLSITGTHAAWDTHIQRVRPGSDAFFTTTIIATCLISADLLDIDPRHYSDNTQLCLYKAVITGLHNNRSLCYYLCLSFFELKEFTFSVFPVIWQCDR